VVLSTEEQKEGRRFLRARDRHQFVIAHGLATRTGASMASPNAPTNAANTNDFDFMAATPLNGLPQLLRAFL
jgi:hypothetical protein